MLRYSSLVGKRVQAHYRAGDIHLSAVGTLVSDSGKSVFLEERFSQGGKDKTMRVEIPYAYVISIGEARSEQPGPVFSKPFSSKKLP
jgi:sporulation protein YlmC with PRC-barrel domain